MKLHWLCYESTYHVKTSSLSSLSSFLLLSRRKTTHTFHKQTHTNILTAVEAATIHRQHTTISAQTAPMFLLIIIIKCLFTLTFLCNWLPWIPDSRSIPTARQNGKDSTWRLGSNFDDRLVTMMPNSCSFDVSSRMRV